MNCPNCATPLQASPDGLHFICPNCGQKYKRKQPAAPAPTPAPASIPAPPVRPTLPQNQPQPQWNDYSNDDDDDDDDDDEFDTPTPARKKSGGMSASFIILPFVCILLLASIAANVFLFLNWRKAQDNAQQLNNMQNEVEGDFTTNGDEITYPDVTEPEIIDDSTVYEDNSDAMRQSEPTTDNFTIDDDGNVIESTESSDADTAGESGIVDDTATTDEGGIVDDSYGETGETTGAEPVYDDEGNVVDFNQ